MRAVLVDHLAKIALLVEQPHADHRHAQIAGGLELIAGHVAKPARVNGQSFAQHEFHAEIRNTAQRRLRVGLLKPRGCLQHLPPGLHQVINVFAESGIGQHVLDLVARDRLQDAPGVMRDFPQFGIKLPPHFVGGMIPRPAHIQGQLRQGIESLDFRGKKVVYRVTDTCLFAHDFSSEFVLAGVPGCCTDTARASLTIVCASSRMRRR